MVDGHVEISTRGAEEITAGGKTFFTTHSSHVDLDPATLSGTGSAIVFTSMDGGAPVGTAYTGATVNIIPCPAEPKSDEKLAKATVKKLIAASK